MNRKCVNDEISTLQWQLGVAHQQTRPMHSWSFLLGCKEQLHIATIEDFSLLPIADILYMESPQITPNAIQVPLISLIKLPKERKINKWMEQRYNLTIITMEITI
jgi:hypothetical protein